MGLLNEYTKVKLSGKNIKHFEKLGYEIPKHFNKHGILKYNIKDEIVVKTIDLPEGSGKKIDASCDCCNKIGTCTYQAYVEKNNKYNGYYCYACLCKMFRTGENNPNYNRNKTDEERENGRNYPEYKDFIRRVLARDNYTCQCCGQKQGNLEVHHMDGYNWCIEKRTDDTNGITLCEICHSSFHSTYGTGNNTKSEFEEWLGKAVKLVKNNIPILPCKQVYCLETDTVYDSADDICKKLNIKCKTHVYDVCTLKNDKYKSVCGYHLMWYDDYINMTETELKEYIHKVVNKNQKQIICLETLEVFNSIASVAKKYKPSNLTGNGCGQIVSACKDIQKTAYGFHWMYYTDYSKRIKNGDVINIPKSTKSKEVICTTTNKKFDSILEASLFYNINPSGISSCCQGRTSSCGTLYGNTPLCWLYYNDYLKKIENGEEIITIVSNKYRKKKIICITTGIIFNNAKDASIYEEIDNSSITKCCKGKQKTAGKLPDGTPLQWMYYEDFLKLPQEEQNEILERNKDSSTDGSFIDYKTNNERTGEI